MWNAHCSVEVYFFKCHRFYKTTQQTCKHVTWEQVSYHLINDPDMMCGNQFTVENADFVEVIFL